jgi:hypothetical protein
MTMIRSINKKCRVSALIIVVAVLGISATRLTDKPVNLKVLPKDISDSLLNRIMLDDCGDALGVTCEYCHVEDKASKKFDYASDAKPEKDTARSMMRMTLELNRRYFGQSKPALGDPTMYITCYTCHHGYPTPQKAEKKQVLRP